MTSSNSNMHKAVLAVRLFGANTTPFHNTLNEEQHRVAIAIHCSVFEEHMMVRLQSHTALNTYIIGPETFKFKHTT